LVKKTIIFVISVYRKLMSPLLIRSCRYHPSCSEYTIEAVEKHGPIKGVGMGILRLFRCNQFFEGGYDPVK